MRAEHKIKREILREAQRYNPDEFNFGPLDTTEQVETAYEVLVNADAHWDYEAEFRPGEFETDVPCPSSRHYESRSVAMKTTEGDWIGWTYYFGGGKHGEPELIEWMSEAYDLVCHEEEKLVLVRTFEKKEDDLCEAEASE